MARRLLEERNRRDGVSLPDDVAAELDDVDRLAAWETARARAEGSERQAGTSGTPSSLTPLRLPTMTVTTAEAVRRLGVSERAVRARLARGTLRGQLVGGKWQVDVDDLDRLAPGRERNRWHEQT